MNQGTITLSKENVYEQEEGQSEEILRILERHRDNHGGLIAILEALQAMYGYLPEEQLRMTADRTNYSLVDIYGVATFYRSFSLKPRGKHLVSICLGTACHVRSAPMVVEEFQRQLGISVGDTTPDKEFTLETVNCLGACALGPIVLVDDHYFSKVNTTEVASIVEKVRSGLPQIEKSATGTFD